MTRDSSSLFHKFLNIARFRLRGIRVPWSCRFYGPVILRIEGSGPNIEIGENVSFMPYVDLKVRENGRIVIKDNCRLDTCARIVAAREATVTLHEGAELGMASIINGGDDVDIGPKSAVAAYCSLISSEHKYGEGKQILQGEYNRAPVVLGANCWLANSVILRPGTRLGDGCVVGAYSLVKGAFPCNSVLFGNPAKQSGLKKHGSKKQA